MGDAQWETGICGCCDVKDCGVGCCCKLYCGGECIFGSAMEKAVTLITARDELHSKIQQLNAVAAAHAQASRNASVRNSSLRKSHVGSPNNLRHRTTSFSATI